jgi:signal transduction histidine kinase
MAAKTYSLRRRIIGLVSILVFISGLSIGALALYTSWHEIEEVYDAQLIHAAKVLRQLTIHELREHEEQGIDLIPETDDLGYKYEQNIAFRIWRDGIPITRSENAVAFGDLQAPPGLSNHRIGDERWRFFVLVDSSTDITVETSERYEIRYELIGYLLLGLLLPASLFIPAVLLAVWYGTSLGLRPLAEVSRDVDSRDSEDLRSIELARTPREIDPLIAALNRLLKRLGETIERERDFTDNAAHELRTPLAAIKTQTQALKQRLKHLPECRESLSNLLSSSDRAAHLVDKLLAFSRLQKEPPKRREVELSELLREVVGELAPGALARDQHVILHADQPMSVHGDRHAIGIMTRNLLENAIKYTPRGGNIEVSLDSEQGRASISVSDDGPGIADGEKERVLRRFYRINDGETTGSGLGLAIAKWISEQHSASLTLGDAEPHGLRCTVTFPGTPGSSSPTG